MSPRERVTQAVRAVEDSSAWTWRTVTIVWKWLMAPLVSHWQGLSLTRFLAAFIAVLVGHEVMVHEKSLSWVDFWMMLSAIATAFGKPVFAILLSRVGLKSSTLDRTENINAKIEQTVTQITDERRGLDYQPTV